MNPGRQHDDPIKTAVISGCFLLLTLAACSPSSTTLIPVETAIIPTHASPTPEASFTSPASLTVEFNPTSTPSLTTTPATINSWQNLPIIPESISEGVREIYHLGLNRGNNPHIFSRIGDCISAAPYFLVGFDKNYNLGAYTFLQPAIDYFRGSFERPSLAAKNGLNTAGLLSTFWTGEQCRDKETLLDCQYRLDNPSFAIISIGSNEAYYIRRDPASFEKGMRSVIEDTISRGIVPILGTKADNLEGNHAINATIARLAQEYEIPLWNFWRATSTLPLQGMIDEAHLTTVSYANFTDFSIPRSMEYGTQVRNLTALKLLDFLRIQLGGTSAVGVETSTP